GYSGGTPPGTNGVFLYTDQAMELQAPIHHQGSPLATTDSGAFSGQITGYLYYEYEYSWDYFEWYPKSPVALNTLLPDCNGQSFPADDPSCVCEVCSTGPDIISSSSTVTTCGAGDVNTFASTGMPGYSDSPWDGTPWSGTVNPPPPYYARKCTKAVDYNSNNHRSWHPVMQPTGRTAAVRDLGGDTSAFLAPWSAGVGTQTMYCSDCHGSDTVAGTVEPTGGEDGNPWGPHGSNNDFLLKGGWDDRTGTAQSNDLCFKCHNYDAYGNPDPVTYLPSGFSTDTNISLCGSPTVTNLHTAHAKAYEIGNGALGVPLRCTACHVAVPHGWKNKALLVNLKDVGPEAGLPPGSTIHKNDLPYNNAPYYLNAVNYIYNFKPSGQWTEQDCGSSEGPDRQGMMQACGNLP
ncbi:MAG: cytochrome c3 family protein, partial [Gammaproteobacteria bacterium]|nr:cytochrome c3 family protein [Gammaproteobacteria bacterium]